MEESGDIIEFSMSVRMIFVRRLLCYANGEKRGYVVVELDARSCTVGFEALDDVKDMHSAVRRLATFAVEDGAPGVKAA